MVNYEPLKVIFNILRLVKIILDMVVKHHGLLDLIVLDKNLLFTLKFWFLLYHFFGIKQKLLITFHPQIDGWSKCQNRTIKAYFQAFVNFKQNN